MDRTAYLIVFNWETGIDKEWLDAELVAICNSKMQFAAQTTHYVTGQKTLAQRPARRCDDAFFDSESSRTSRSMRPRYGP